MKPIIIICILLTLFACTANLKTQVFDWQSDNFTTPKDTLVHPFKPYYSASFEMGNPDHSQIILGIWNDWDNNQLENSLKYLADTISFHFPDGTRYDNKKKEAVLQKLKTKRLSFTKTRSNVGAWLPFRSTDRDENWVAVWGTKYYTAANGLEDSVDVHEIYAFDKNNKVKFLSQYDALFNLKQRSRVR